MSLLSAKVLLSMLERISQINSPFPLFLLTDLWLKVSHSISRCRWSCKYEFCHFAHRIRGEEYWILILALVLKDFHKHTCPNCFFLLPIFCFSLLGWNIPGIVWGRLWEWSLCLGCLINVGMNQKQVFDEIDLYTCQFLFMFFMNETEMAQEFCEICSANSLFFQMPPMTLAS